MMRTQARNPGVLGIVVALIFGVSSACVAGPGGVSALVSQGKAADSRLILSRATKAASPAVRARVKGLMASMPLLFVPNRGQVDQGVRYYARGKGMAVSVTPNGLVMGMGNQVITITASKGNAERVYGRLIAPTRVNYFIGNDPSKWQRGLPTFGEVVLHNLYPGIDMVVSGDEGRLTTDFVVYPGADPSVIQMKVEGARLEVDSEGRLVLKAEGNALAFSAPVSYQAVDGRLKGVRAGSWWRATATALPLAITRRRPPL